MVFFSSKNTIKNLVNTINFTSFAIPNLKKFVFITKGGKVTILGGLDKLLDQGPLYDRLNF